MNDNIVAAFSVITKLMEAEASKGQAPVQAPAPQPQQNPVASPPAQEPQAPANNVMPISPPVQVKPPLTLDDIKQMDTDAINENWQEVQQVLTGNDAPAQ